MQLLRLFRSHQISESAVYVMFHLGSASWMKNVFKNHCRQGERWNFYAFLTILLYTPKNAMRRELFAIKNNFNGPFFSKQEKHYNQRERAKLRNSAEHFTHVRVGIVRIFEVSTHCYVNFSDNRRRERKLKVSSKRFWYFSMVYISKYYLYLSFNYDYWFINLFLWVSCFCRTLFITSRCCWLSYKSNRNVEKKLERGKITWKVV